MAAERSGYDATDLHAAALLTRGEPRTVEDLLEVGERVLGDSSHIDPLHDVPAMARRLLAVATGGAVPADTATVPWRQRERYLSSVARRAAGEPLEFITGAAEFCGLEIRVRPGMFVPRPSSALLVDTAVAALQGRSDPVLLDMCTGSGAIALAVAARLQGGRVWGVDISAVAIRQAAANARRLGLPARFRVSDLYERLPSTLRGRVDVITGYVPYLGPEDVAGMYTEAREYEPLFTLLDLGDDPFSLMRRVTMHAPLWLRPGGRLLIEVDPAAATMVEDMARGAGLIDISVADSPESWDVVVAARCTG